jgi:hypothetical protein
MNAPLFRLVLIIGVTILLLMAGVAQAGPRFGASAPRRPAMTQRQAEPSAPRLTRDVTDTRAAQQLQPSSPQQRPGKMTPDERRALRRQIQDDSRDVYRPAPH